ncbi:DNA-binding transcriptional regulator, LysR family [Paracoccus halophilus]|uniref:DNA-binding transcriptional regulator, LysR family n=1 Tax=Paracoccus halophilus TaxID=376733 RepID=A0A1I0TF67_9RHOB|nr:LysR family transcriptional regulator [Paracoccus halophilus]SFA50424.1 DNA-binding transcriptional regulator, LysR family [Paracoccus halophilus]
MHPNLLEQLHVFRTVVDCGSFSKGADRLNKTVSSVSYTISNLETHLRLTLFDRTSYRLKLTDPGESVYAESELLLRRVDRFRAHVGRISGGEKTELRLSVDHLFPRFVLMDALSQLAAWDTVPHVTLRLAEMDHAIEDLLNGRADIALHSIDIRLSYRDIDGAQVGSTENMLVAAPQHPLATRDRPFTMPELENHRQLVLALAETPKGKDNYQVHRTETWTLGDVETMIGLLKAGRGWAFMHRHFVAAELAAGRLVTLDCKDIRSWRLHRFGASWRVADPPSGSHGQFLDALRSSFRSSDV